MCFVIIIERLFRFLLFRAMTLSLLHLVGWQVFTINICYFISNLHFYLMRLLIKLGLMSAGQIYTMQNFVKMVIPYGNVEIF